MAESKLPPRPRQVTMAAGVGLVSSVLLVLSLFDALTRIRSVEMRTSIAEFLAEPPGNGLGLTPGGVVEVLRGLVFLNGALAATAAVLAVYVFQRHHGARIGFSIAAGLLLLTSPVTGGALAILVAFAATLLWGRPARDWFAGREPQPAPAPPAPAPPAPAPSDWEPTAPAAPGGDHGESTTGRPGPAAYPFGQQSRSGWPPPAHGAQPSPGTDTGSAGGPARPVGAPDRRPGTVTAAVLLTLISSAVMLVLFLGIIVMLVAAKDTIIETLEQNPGVAGAQIPTQDLLAALWVTSAICAVWALAAITLAVLALRRMNWARITLVVSSVVSGLLALLGGWVGAILTVVAVLTVVLLFTGGANRWYAGRSRAPHPPPGPGPGQLPVSAAAAPQQQQQRKRPQVW